MPNDGCDDKILTVLPFCYTLIFRIMNTIQTFVPFFDFLLKNESGKRPRNCFVELIG